MTDLTGKWNIVLVYGFGYGKIANQKLICCAEIIQDRFKINGIVIDKEGIGMSPDKANIYGTFKNGIIKFIKQYDSLHLLNEDNTIEIKRSYKGKKIYYEAKYDENSDEFFGTWAYKVKAFGFIKIKKHGEGTWTMKRE